MLEIVHLGKHYYPHFGGIETATKALAEAGVEFGFPVTCYTAADRPSKAEKYSINGVNVFRAFTIGKMLSTPIAFGLLWPKRHQEHILHVHLPNPLGELAALLQIFIYGKKTKLVPFLHALPFRNRGIGALWYRFFTKPLLKKSEFILISNINLLKIFPALREFETKIRVIPFATNVLEAKRDDSVWATRFSSQIVLAVGRLVAYKGYKQLIRAWSQLPSIAREEGRQLVIIGDGPLRRDLELLVDHLGLSKSVKLLGSCPDDEKQKWMERALFFAMPSQNESETFGISMLEAMAQALPVMTTDLQTGVSLLARNGACGAICIPGDNVGLVHALETLLSADQKTLRSIGESNRKFVIDELSFHKLRQEYKKLIDELYTNKGN